MDPKSPDPGKKKDQASLQKMSMALALPSMMIAGPAAGYLLAQGAVRWFEIGAPWDRRFPLIGIFVGLAAALRETVAIVKRISR